MAVGRWATVLIVSMQACVLWGQDPVAIQRPADTGGMPPSGGYKPPALSLSELMQSDSALQEALMAFARTKDRNAFGKAILDAAQSGNVGAELTLGEQYIPEQCPGKPNQDVPNCGERGQTSARTYPKNPLGIDASYEEASRWLEKASAHGSGEASEVLAQLITRMQQNGHTTNYSAADSAHFHAVARSQGFDAAAIRVECFKLIPGQKGITVAPLPSSLAEDPANAFSEQELSNLRRSGIAGVLQLTSGSGPGSGDSVLLQRPEPPIAHVRVILDHAPKGQTLLPIPARRDVIYVQRGDEFLVFPSSGENLPRFILIEGESYDPSQAGISVQGLDGGYSGGGCGIFP